jgi:hypothetical protein
VTLKCSKVAVLPRAATDVASEVDLLGVAVTVTVGVPVAAGDAVTVVVDAGLDSALGPLEHEPRLTISRPAVATTATLWFILPLGCRNPTVRKQAAAVSQNKRLGRTPTGLL